MVNVNGVVLVDMAMVCNHVMFAKGIIKIEHVSISYKMRHFNRSG